MKNLNFLKKLLTFSIYKTPVYLTVFLLIINFNQKLSAQVNCSFMTLSVTQTSPCCYRLNALVKADCFNNLSLQFNSGGNFTSTPVVNPAFGNIVSSTSTSINISPANGFWFPVNPTVPIAVMDFCFSNPNVSSTPLSITFDNICAMEGCTADIDLMGCASLKPCDLIGSKCHVKSINVSTGVSFNGSTVLGPGQSDPNWTVISQPLTSSLSLPMAPTVLNSYTGWASPTSASWISPFIKSTYNQNNCIANNCSCIPFVYERGFCVCDSGRIVLNFKFASDNAGEVLLFGPGLPASGISLYSNCSTPNASSNFSTFQSIVANHLLPQPGGGQYFLQIRHWNNSEIAMGVILDGTITGDNLVSDACCDTTGNLMVIKYYDKNCNGKFDTNFDSYLPGWKFTLNPGNIMATTGSTGQVFFPNLATGTYTVTETSQLGWTPSVPISGTTIVSINSNNISTIYFANCKDTCKCDPNGSFQSMSHRPIGGPNVFLNCGDTSKTICNNNSLAWTLSGVIHCSPLNCTPGSFGATLTNPDGSPGLVSVISGPPNFSISIPPGQLTSTGFYTLNLSVLCGTNTCKCKIIICVEGCCLEDFEDEAVGTKGQWQVVSGTLSVINDAPPRFHVLRGVDGQGGSNFYNPIEYDGNWIQKYKGCFCFDIRYDNNSSTNSATGTNTLNIHNGNNIANSTLRAVFVTSPVGNNWVRKCAPVALAGASLPSNNDGQWVMVPSINATVDAANFNSLITSVQGVSFLLDFGNIANDPSELLYIDNICIEKCSQCECKGLRWATVFNTQSGNELSVGCNNVKPIEISCKKFGPNFFLHGDLECSSIHCATDSVWWELGKPSSPSSSGSVNLLGTYPHFDISIPWNEFTTPGNYTLTICRMCGNKPCCCTINIKVLDCDCSCEKIEELNNDVNQGFNSTGGNCTKCFKPIGLCKNDQVNWFIKNGAAYSPLGQTQGNSQFCHTFSNFGYFTVCMIVTRIDPKTLECCQDTFCKRIKVNCIISVPEHCENNIIINGNFNENLRSGFLEESGIANPWYLVPGLTGKVFIDNQDGAQDEGSVILKSSPSGIVGICQELGSTLDSTKIHLEFEYYNYGEQEVQLEIKLQKDFYSLPSEGISILQIGLKSGQSWTTIDSTIVLSSMSNLKFFAIYVSNPNKNEIANVALDNIVLCQTGNFSTGVSDKFSKPSGLGFRIYPNPNFGQYTLLLDKPGQENCKVNFLDLTGKLLLEKELQAGEQLLSIQLEEVPNGIYFIQLLDQGKRVATQKWIKQ